MKTKTEYLQTFARHAFLNILTLCLLLWAGIKLESSLYVRGWALAPWLIIFGFSLRLLHVYFECPLDSDSFSKLNRIIDACAIGAGLSFIFIMTITLPEVNMKAISVVLGTFGFFVVYFHSLPIRKK